MHFIYIVLDAETLSDTHTHAVKDFKNLRCSCISHDFQFYVVLCILK